MNFRYHNNRMKSASPPRALMLFLLMVFILVAGRSVQAAPTIDYPSVTQASALTLNGDARILSDQSIQLTTVNQNFDSSKANYDPTVVQAGSVFYNNAVNVSKFTTTFRFQLTPWAGRPAGDPWADGITFAIQNQGANALGWGGSGLGYAGIDTSVALKFKTFALGDPNNGGDPSSSTVAMLVNGQDPTGAGIGLTDLLAYGPDFDLGSGATFRADVSYVNTTLTLTLTNENTNAAITLRFTVNIPAFVGGNSAFVGLSGGTGLFVADQRILSWQYTEQGASNNTLRPTITTISPSSATVGSGAFQMTINGAGFGPNAVARFDNTPLSNVSVTTTQMIVNVPASLLTTKKTFNVTVANGAAYSNAVPFRVVAATNAQPAPILRIIGSHRTGRDSFSGNRYVVLLLENQGAADITNLDFSNVRLYFQGTNYIVPVSMMLEPGASPAGSLSLVKPGQRLQIRWDFNTTLPDGQIAVMGTSSQGSFNAGTRYIQFP